MADLEEEVQTGCFGTVQVVLYPVVDNSILAMPRFAQGMVVVALGVRYWYYHPRRLVDVRCL